MIKNATLKKLMVFLLVFALMFTALPTLSTSTVYAEAMTDAESIQIVKDRIKAKFLESDAYRVVSGAEIYSYTSKAMEYAESIQPDGSWEDVNYADRTSSANGKFWSPYYALYRITSMAMGYNQEGNPAYRNPIVKDAIEKALIYWDSVKPSSTNWWENEIGQAMCLGVTGIFMEGIISKQALDVCINYNRGRLDTVGANGVWRTQNYLYKMLVQNNYAEIRKGILTLAETLAVDETGTSSEAVQADGSFYCHGAKLYSEGYGMAQFNMVANWVMYTSGTNFSFPEEALQKLEFYILGGTRWMIRGEFGFLYLGYRKYNTIEGVTSYAADILPGMIIMAKYDSDPERRAKYQQVVDNIKGESITNGLVGNKHFWRSDYTSHMRPNYGIMTKMSSSRINGGEYRSTYRPSIGNEIYWNAAGTTAIFVNGREYTDLVPAFDWSHYPGTTAPYEKMPYSLECRFNASSSFVGGVSNGMYGASVFTQNMNSTLARKGYFYFDDEMVALGAGITSTRPVEVHTTINQGIAKDNASVDGVPVPKGTDPVTYTNPKWAYNDQIGYVFPTDSNVTVLNIDQTSNWIDNPTVTKQAFTLYFNHGIQPSDASYEYIVVPGKDAEEVEEYSKNIPVRILSNTSELQAVRHEGLKQTQIIFYEAGSCEYRTGATITVNQPCLVIVDESSGEPEVTVANPDINGLVVDVKIERTDEDTLYGRYNLGSGIYMGQSLTQKLSNVPLSASNIKASSFLPGFAPLNAIDDDMDSSWRSEPDESQYIIYSMDIPNTLVDKIAINWGDDYAKEYIVQYSMDNINWTDGKLQWNGVGGEEVIELPYVKANYIRILMLSSNNKNGYEIKDLSINTYVNVAQNKPSLASGQDESRAAVYANDGDENTRWSGPRSAANAWWQVDLLRKTKVRTIRISWESSYSTSFKIQTSDDGSTWTDVDTFSNDKAGVQILYFPEGSIDARFIRLQSITKVNNYGISFYEFEVFEEAGVPAPLPNYGGRTNLAFGKTVTYDSTYDGSKNVEEPIETTIPTDGNYGTRLSTGRGDAGITERSLYVDLGEPLTVNEIKLFWQVNTEHVIIEYTNDLSEPWLPLAEVKRDIYKGNEQDVVKFAPTTARYIRVRGVMATKYGLSLYEIEVYGDYSFKLDKNAITLDKGDTIDLNAYIFPYEETDVAEFKSYNTDAVTVGATTAIENPEIEGEGIFTVTLEAVSGGSSVVIVRHSDGPEYDLCTVKVNTYKDDLQALYDIASQLDQNDYISSTWTDSNIDNILINANILLIDETATQRQVDSIIEDLKNAMSVLVKKANKDSLVEIISQVKSLKQTDYTAESWKNANIEKLLADADSIYFDEYATQEEVDSIVAELNEAVNSLVKAPKPGGPGPIIIPIDTETDTDDGTDTAPNVSVSDTSTEARDSATSTITVDSKTDEEGKTAAIVTESEITEAINKLNEALEEMGEDAAANLEIKVSAPADSETVEISLPKAAVDSVIDNELDTVTVSLPIANITFDKDSVETISQVAEEDVKIIVTKVDSASLSGEAAEVIGDRPVLSFNVISGDRTISQFTGDITVSIPYTPKEGEDIEAIVIYYINSQGQLELISNCAYNEETGMISFKTNHFSKYAVGYNKIGFNDVAEGAWYSKAVSFIAARGITLGTGNGNFSPGEKLTRGQFLTMIMRAYGIKPDENPTDNFADAGEKYYTGYLAAAKRLGISKGIGNNMFAPDKEITREDMCTLLYNTLMLIGELPEKNTGKNLSEFNDADDIAEWARPAMSMFVEAGIINGSLNKLSPKDTTTRAEMAQVLYNLITSNFALS